MREMKYSGINYIGEIPYNWGLTKIKYCADIFGRIGFRGYTEQDLVDYEEDGAITLSPSNIHDMKMDYKKCTYLSWKKYEESPEIMINNGDVLLVKTGTCGKVAYVTDLPKEATINPQLIVFKNIRLDSKLFSYILQTKMIDIQTDLAVVGGVIPTMSQEKIYNFIIPDIPKNEQHKLLVCIDQECEELDALISDIRFQIETLEEYKKSLIFRVVSKGMKKKNLKETASDVWTSIPENWQLVDIKYIFEIVKRIAGQEGFDVFSVTQKGLKVKDIKSNNGQQAESYAGYQFVYPTDYVMNHMDLLTGGVDCSTMFGVTSPDYRVFRLRDKKCNDLTYFKYLMQCCYLCRIFYSLGQGVSNLGRWRLQTSVFNNFMIPVPPLDDQREIAEYLENKITEIDSIITDKQKQIETIEEYKKSLIFEYVTGKKEVQA